MEAKSAGREEIRSNLYTRFADIFQVQLDSLCDVPESFCARVALGDTARQCRDSGDTPSVTFALKNHGIFHGGHTSDLSVLAMVIPSLGSPQAFAPKESLSGQLALSTRTAEKPTRRGADTSFDIQLSTLEKIRRISLNTLAAEQFFERFVESIGGTKMDNALELGGAVIGGADYLFQNDIVAELKILEKDVWDDYNQKMNDLFARFKNSGELRSDINQEHIGVDDPEIPLAMQSEWYSILLKPIDKKFCDADRQTSQTKKFAPRAKGLLLLLNIQNRLHAEPLRLFWLVRDKVLKGRSYPNIGAWAYFCLPVPQLMSAGVNQSIFWGHFTRPENETPEGWKDQNLFMKCRGLEGQWQSFLQHELGLPIRNIPASQIRWPKP
jgi:hypothetical protein